MCRQRFTDIATIFAAVIHYADFSPPPPPPLRTHTHTHTHTFLKLCIGRSFQENKAFCQRCVLFPYLFSLYSEIIIRNLEGYLGIKVGGGHNVNKEDLQQLLDIVAEENRKKGLELSSKKAEEMGVNQNNECPVINIFIKGNELKQSDQFKYLGTLISSDGHNNSEIALRIAPAKTKNLKKKYLEQNNNLLHIRRTDLD